MPEPTRTSRARRHARDARAFVITWSAGLLSGCVPGPSADRAAIEAIERIEYPVRLAGGEFRVSAMRAGDADAPRLIYVHGTPGNGEAFSDYLLDPIPGFESLSIDRPGFGKTRPLKAVPSFADQAAAIEPLLVERNGRWPILVGHSLGGPIIARAAADYPERVGGLVILGGSLDPALEDPKWFNYLGNTWPARGLIGRTMRTSNDEILAAVEETRSLARVLDRVRCPIVIVHGTEDGLVPVENVGYMRRQFAHIEHVRVVVLEGVGHFIPWSHEMLIRGAIGELAGSTDADVSGDD